MVLGNLTRIADRKAVQRHLGQGKGNAARRPGAEASAGSSDSLFKGLKLLAAVVRMRPALDLGRRQLAVRLDDRLLAVHPLRLDRVEPRALARQRADHD